MGPNHTERLADGLDVVEPGRPGYRQLLALPAPAPATRRRLPSVRVLLGLVVLVAVNAGAMVAIAGPEVTR